MIPATQIVVPMKPFAESKTRLRDALSEDQRRLLSLAMLVHVARTAASISDASVTVLGGDRAVEQACALVGCAFVANPPGEDLSACLRGAFDDARTRGATTALFVPADLPLLVAGDIEALIRTRAGGGAYAIAPDRHNTGTNALAVHEPAPFNPAMGGGSFVRHLSQMAMSGARYEICRTPGLALDIDTPADLDVLLRQRPDWWESAAQLVDGLEWRT